MKPQRNDDDELPLAAPWLKPLSPASENRC